jgi:hypothetical protein
MWQQSQRPNYDDLKRVDYRPSTRDLNAYNISRLLDDSFFEQLLHKRSNTVDEMDAMARARLTHGSLNDAELTGAIDGGRSRINGRRRPPMWSKTATVDETAEPSRRSSHAVKSRGISLEKKAGECVGHDGDLTDGQVGGEVVDGETASGAIGLQRNARRPPVATEATTSLPPIVELTVEETSSAAENRAPSGSHQKQSELRLPQIV